MKIRGQGELKRERDWEEKRDREREFIYIVSAKTFLCHYQNTSF